MEQQACGHGKERGEADSEQGRRVAEIQETARCDEKGQKMKSLTPRPKPRAEPNVGKMSSRPSSTGESSCTSTLVGPAKTLKRSEATAAKTMIRTTPTEVI